MSSDQNADNHRSKRRLNRALAGTLDEISERKKRIADALARMGDVTASEQAAEEAINAGKLAGRSRGRQRQAEDNLTQLGIPQRDWSTKNSGNKER